MERQVGFSPHRIFIPTNSAGPSIPYRFKFSTTSITHLSVHDKYSNVMFFGMPTKWLAETDLARATRALDEYITYYKEFADEVIEEIDKAELPTQKTFELVRGRSQHRLESLLKRLKIQSKEDADKVESSVSSMREYIQSAEYLDDRAAMLANAVRQLQSVLQSLHLLEPETNDVPDKPALRSQRYSLWQNSAFQPDGSPDTVWSRGTSLFAEQLPVSVYLHGAWASPSYSAQWLGQGILDVGDVSWGSDIHYIPGTSTIKAIRYKAPILPEASSLSQTPSVAVA